MSANSGHTPAADWVRINASPERDYTYALCCLGSNQKGARFEQAVSASALTFINAALYNWNYLDELVCGYNTTLSPALRYNRVRMVLLPLPMNLTEKVSLRSLCIWIRRMTYFLSREATSSR